MDTTLTPTGCWGEPTLLKPPALTQTTAGRPLAGRRIALTDAVKADAFASMLLSRGADVLRFPLATTRGGSPLGSDSSAAFKLWLADLLEGRIQDMIWTTPEGIREALRLAARHNADWQLVAAMARVRTFVSGLATARTLHQLGFVPDLTTPRNAGDADLIKALRKHNLIGRTVGVQLHTEAAGDELLKFLRWMRADARPILPYQAASADDHRAVQRLVRMICTSQFDALAFSDAAEARLLQAMAAKTGQLAVFADRLTSIHVVALSPRIAGELRDLGIHPDIVPPKSFFVFPVVEDLVAALQQDRIPPRAVNCN